MELPEKPSSDDSRWWHEGVAVFGEVTGWIVIPVIAALYSGRYLDAKYSTGNTYFLILTGLAFLVSCAGIWMMGRRYIRMVEQSKKERNHGNTTERRDQ